MPDEIHPAKTIRQSARHDHLASGAQKGAVKHAQTVQSPPRSNVLRAEGCRRQACRQSTDVANPIRHSSFDACRCMRRISTRALRWKAIHHDRRRRRREPRNLPRGGRQERPAIRHPFERPVSGIIRALNPKSIVRHRQYLNSARPERPLLIISTSAPSARARTSAARAERRARPVIDAARGQPVTRRVRERRARHLKPSGPSASRSELQLRRRRRNNSSTFDICAKKRAVYPDKLSRSHCQSTDAQNMPSGNPY